MWNVECGMWNVECALPFPNGLSRHGPHYLFSTGGPLLCAPSVGVKLASIYAPALLQYIINMYSSRGARVCAHTRIHARLTSSSFAIIVFYFYFFFPPSFFLFFFFFSSSRSFKVHSSQFSSHFFATFFFLVKRVFFLLIFSPHYRLSHFFPFPCSEPPTLAVALTGCDVM